MGQGAGAKAAVMPLSRSSAGPASPGTSGHCAVACKRAEPKQAETSQERESEEEKRFPLREALSEQRQVEICSCGRREAEERPAWHLSWSPGGGYPPTRTPHHRHRGSCRTWAMSSPQ